MGLNASSTSQAPENEHRRNIISVEVKVMEGQVDFAAFPQFGTLTYKSVSGPSYVQVVSGPSYVQVVHVFELKWTQTLPYWQMHKATKCAYVRVCVCACFVG